MDDALDAAKELLRDRLWSVDDLLSELQRRGHDTDPDRPGDRDDFVDGMTERGYWHFGEFLVLPAQVLAGRVFTHAVSFEEAQNGYLRAGPDLVPVAIDDSRVFETGVGTFDEDFDEEGGPILRLRRPALPWPPGTIVAVRWLGPGRLDVDVLERRIPVDPSLVARFGDAAGGALGPDGTAMFLNLIGGLLVAHPDAFRAAASPIGELVEAAGLELRRDEVAPRGFDWEVLDERRRLGRIASKARRWALVEEQAERFDRIESAVYRLTRAPEAIGEADRTAAALQVCQALGRDRRLNALFLAWINGLAHRLPQYPVTETLVAAATASVGVQGFPAALHMLRARIAERSGDAAGHEAAVKDALAADAEFDPARQDAAWIASERGDASRALTLLGALGGDVSREEIETLAWYASPGPMSAGRNQRCPCGSERKHKQCCGRHNGHALDDRFMWRLIRATEFAHRPVQREHLLRLVRRTFGVDTETGDDLPAAILFVGTQHPAMLWLSLAEGGGLERYLAERGALFPEDERELLRSWLPLRHRLLRFDRASDERGSGDGVHLVRVVDLLSGEGFDVPALYGAGQPRPGDVALMVVASDGTSPRLVGVPTAVAPEHLEPTKALLTAPSPDPAALARLLLRDRLEELAGELEDRIGDFDDELDDFDDHDLDHFDDVFDDDLDGFDEDLDAYFDRLELVLALLEEVDEQEVLGRDPWNPEAPLSDDELFALMAAAHPEHADAIRSGREVEVAGEAVSPRLHVAMHTVAARQIIDASPPATYATALRLLDDGYDLHEVMHMLSRVVSGFVYATIKDGMTPDGNDYAAALDALPGDWEHERHRIGAQHRARSRRRGHHRPRS